MDSRPAALARIRRTVLGLVTSLPLLLIPEVARSQCSYPVLTDDTPQTFTSTPAFARFTQSAGRWAAAGVRASMAMATRACARGVTGVATAVSIT
jgi:hypothetical protein